MAGVRTLQPSQVAALRARRRWQCQAVPCTKPSRALVPSFRRHAEAVAPSPRPEHEPAEEFEVEEKPAGPWPGSQAGGDGSDPPSKVLARAAATNLGAATVSALFIQDVLGQELPLRWGVQDVAVAVALGVAGGLPFVLFVRNLLERDAEDVERKAPALANFRANLESFRSTVAGLSLEQICLLSTLVAVGEEAMFRGVIQGGIASVGAPVVGLLASSAVFGALHARDPLYVAFTAAGSLAFGTVHALAGYNVLAPIISHGFFDAWLFWAISGAAAAAPEPLD